MRSKITLPNLKSLVTFEAAARNLSFKVAAQELHVSQSAVSHQIRNIESFLGTKLFIRKSRSVELTPQGKNYFPKIKYAFNSISEATNETMGEFSNSVLTVQLYSTFAIRWMIPRLPEFKRVHPDIHIRLHTSQENVDFDHQDIDVAIMIGKPNNSGLHYDHLFGGELFPVCSPKYIEMTGAIGDPEDLDKHTILQVYPSKNDWIVWLSSNGLSNVELDYGLDFDSYEASLITAGQGMGIAMGQQPYVNEDIQSGVLVEIFPNLRVKNPDRWYLACLKQKSEDYKVKVFRGWLMSEIHNDNNHNLN